MASFNKVILMGNLTRDPESRVTPTGTTIVKFSLAINERYKDKETAVFVECDAFQKTAEFVSKYFSKGDPILVEGKLRLDTWEDSSTGQRRSKLGVVVNNAGFVGGKGGDNAQQQEEPRRETKQYAPPPDRQQEQSVIDNDIPF